MYRLKIPSYLAHSLRRQIAELYVSSIIADFSLAMMLIFEPVYFITVLHWGVSKILLFWAAIYFFYIILIPWGANIASRRGYEHAMLYSTPFQIGYWLCLFFAPQAPWLMVLAVLFYAIEKSLFWPAFHADMSRFSIAGQRSREFTGLYVVLQIMYIVGPFIGGVISEKFGVRALLIVASVVYFTMFIPMFTTPEVFTPKPYFFKSTLKYYKKITKEAIVYFGFGQELYLFVVWPIFIYLTVPDFFKLGSLVSITTLVSTIIALYAGKLSDEGERRGIIVWGSLVTFITWIGRSFVATVTGVMIADTSSRTGADLYNISLTSNVYDRANEEQVLPYSVFFEQALSIGKMVAGLLGAILFALTHSFIPLFVVGAAFALCYLALPKSPKILLPGQILNE